MKIIKLTGAVNGERVFINADHIVSFEKSAQEDAPEHLEGQMLIKIATRIRVSDHCTVLVNETPEEIIELLSGERTI